MSADLYINGTRYPLRTGTGAYGSLFKTVKPPSPSGVTFGAIEQLWGSRIAETIGRGRGLSGVGTLPYRGTVEIVFPPVYFENAPIISVMDVVFFNPNPYNYWDSAKYVNLIAPVENQFVGLRQNAPYPNIYHSVNYVPYRPLEYYYNLKNLYDDAIMVCNIGSLGFRMIHRDKAYGPAYDISTEPNIVYWHAFGI